MKQVQVKFSMLIVSTLLTCMHKQPISYAFETHDISCNGSHGLTHDYQAFYSEVIFLLSVEAQNLLTVLNILSLLLHF
jgi:hypothetical protein